MYQCFSLGIRPAGASSVFWVLGFREPVQYFRKSVNSAGLKFSFGDSNFVNSDQWSNAVIQLYSYLYLWDLAEILHVFSFRGGSETRFRATSVLLC